MRERVALRPIRRTSVRDRTPIELTAVEPSEPKNDRARRMAITVGTEATEPHDGQCRAACALLQRLFCRRCCCAEPIAESASSLEEPSTPRPMRRSSVRVSGVNLPNIPRLAKNFMEPHIKFGNKLVKPTAARDALMAPVRNAKLNVKRWLRLSILSTLVFGLLSISWHALNCHLWIQLLGMYRAIFLVLPPAIGVVLALFGGLQAWRWVAELPDAVLLQAFAEGLGVDDEGIEAFRAAAAKFNRTVENLEQARTLTLTLTLTLALALTLALTLTRPR